MSVGTGFGPMACVAFALKLRALGRWLAAPMGPGNDSTSPVQSSPSKFWTGIGPIPNSVGPGLDWTGLVWISLALCPGLGYISHCIGLLMGEIYLNGTEYTDRTGIIPPRSGIQR